MLELFTLFILKILDCSLSTFKNLFMIKDKNFYSSLFNSLATYFYLVMITKLTKSNSNVAVIVICTATFLGSFLPALIFNKLQGDKVYIFDIIPNTNELGKEIADDLRDNNNLAVQTYKGYNFNQEKVLCCKVFSNSRTESILIESCLPKDNITFHIVEIKKHVNFNN